MGENGEMLVEYDSLYDTIESESNIYDVIDNDYIPKSIYRLNYCNFPCFIFLWVFNSNFRQEFTIEK